MWPVPQNEFGLATEKYKNNFNSLVNNQTQVSKNCHLHPEKVIITLTNEPIDQGNDILAYESSYAVVGSRW